MKKIVIGYDDTDASKRALERAAQLASAFKSEVVVASVTPMLASVARSSGPIDPTDPPERHAEELAHARSYLEGQGLQADYLGGVGDPGRTIAELAEERGADLIVVGTREVSALQRIFGQSVSDSVLHQARCDVLIVH